MDEKGTWYSDKELFEMIQSLKNDLRDTQEAVRKYNGLLGRLAEVEEAVADMHSQSAARATIEDRILRWGGWCVGIVSLVLAWWKVFVAAPK